MGQERKSIQEQVLAALTARQGECIRVERIEIEAVGRTFRWTLWGAGRRLVTIPGGQADVAEMLECCKILLDGLLDGGPSHA